MIAGVNAALKLQRREPLVLDRDQAYIGVLIDDLVTRGVDEPYRMFTSRAEYRLSLRHDNADRRLTPLGRQIGLVDDGAGSGSNRSKRKLRECWHDLRTTRLGGDTLEKLLRRPEVTWANLAAQAPELADVAPQVAQQVEYDVKYAGYVARQEMEVDRLRRLQEKRIPTSFDYASLLQLRIEAREKLTKIRPITLAQASRISGITPADVAILLVHLQ